MQVGALAVGTVSSCGHLMWWGALGRDGLRGVFMGRKNKLRSSQRMTQCKKIYEWLHQC